MHPRRFGLTLLIVTVPTLLIALGGSAPGFDDDEDKAIKAARKDVLDLAREIADGKGNEAAAKAAAIPKKYEELLTVMYGFKPSTKKGIGMGTGTPGPGDGIEYNIGQMAKGKGLANLKKDRDALIRVGYINVAIAEITQHYPPTKKIANAQARWKQMTGEMKKASHEFIEAVKAGSPDKVKQAADKLNDACLSCHKEFRDS